MRIGLLNSKTSIIYTNFPWKDFKELFFFLETKSKNKHKPYLPFPAFRMHRIYTVYILGITRNRYKQVRMSLSGDTW